ncbi:MAG: hypothetical protein V3U75_06665 [Methylococcaceae bacterium]
MKKKKFGVKATNTIQCNPVAKHSKSFNKAKVFRDKTKYYRTVKFKTKESFAKDLMLLNPLQKALDCSIAAAPKLC